jgi:hypothetical protein
MIAVAASDGSTSIVHYMHDDVLSTLNVPVGTGVVIHPSVDPSKHKVSSIEVISVHCRSLCRILSGILFPRLISGQQIYSSPSCIWSQ